VSTKLYLHKTSEATKRNLPTLVEFPERKGTFGRSLSSRDSYENTNSKKLMLRRNLSPWSRSSAKRVFDCASVLLMMPLILPVLLAIALAVRVTSPGPVLFLQQRMGRNGRNFTIMKFRTMIHRSNGEHHPVTTSDNQRFTSVGPFLRRWKLDELPQLFNVLMGNMSLVGPRPKLPEHAISNLACRAGITGAATIAFAREESILARVPEHHLKSFYHSVVLPAKLQLDADYMAHATFLSDLKLILNSVLRRWDESIMESLLEDWKFEQRNSIPFHSMKGSEHPFLHAAKISELDRPASTGDVRAY
jgi:lipopolysaccharide/colanic/teichoic acid biosynthesis glycosyltransferase